MSPSGEDCSLFRAERRIRMDEITKKLQAPFQAGSIEWRLQNTTADGSRGLAVPYLDNRAIQNRLDEIFTPFGWKNNFLPWQGGSSQLCVISVMYNGEWIDKCDGAENTDIEPVKGGLSDAMKRCAVQLGIGRYLYQMEGIWVDVEKIERKGRTSYQIRQSEFPKLNAAYEKAVREIFGNDPGPSTTTSKSRSKTGNNSNKSSQQDQNPTEIKQDKKQEQAKLQEPESKIVIRERREIDRDGKKLLKFIDGNGEIIFALDNLDFFGKNDEIPESMVEFYTQNNCKVVKLRQKAVA